jgi:hypothetical protein
MDTATAIQFIMVTFEDDMVEVLGRLVDLEQSPGCPICRALPEFTHNQEQWISSMLTHDKSSVLSTQPTTVIAPAGEIKKLFHPESRDEVLMLQKLLVNKKLLSQLYTLQNNTEYDWAIRRNLKFLSQKCHFTENIEMDKTICPYAGCEVIFTSAKQACDHITNTHQNVVDCEECLLAGSPQKGFKIELKNQQRNIISHLLHHTFPQPPVGNYYLIF